MEFLLGDVTLVLSSETGENRLFSLYVRPGENERLFGQTKEFDALPDAATFYAVGQRNKAFLIGEGDTASLRYGTTEKIRWEHRFPYELKLAGLNSKYDRLAFLDAKNILHLFQLDDPHPEASFKAMFGKLWYEGADGPGTNGSPPAARIRSSRSCRWCRSSSARSRARFTPCCSPCPSRCWRQFTPRSSRIRISASFSNP
jgi:ABC-type uncharacterized transport system permease subunit